MPSWYSRRLSSRLRFASAARIVSLGPPLGWSCPPLPHQRTGSCCARSWRHRPPVLVSGASGKPRVDTRAWSLARSRPRRAP
eukprot:5006834-Prymnesium_polylepis.2